MKVCMLAALSPSHADLSFLGMDKMHAAMAIYVKSLSRRAEGADKEKQLPGGHLGSSMVSHGEDFEPDSEFGNCLSCTPSPHSLLPCSC